MSCGRAEGRSSILQAECPLGNPEGAGEGDEVSGTSVEWGLSSLGSDPGTTGPEAPLA